MRKPIFNLLKMIKFKKKKFLFQHLSQVEVTIINTNLKIKKFVLIRMEILYIQKNQTFKALKTQIKVNLRKTLEKEALN